jgi:hypothetical protein
MQQRRKIREAPEIPPSKNAKREAKVIDCLLIGVSIDISYLQLWGQLPRGPEVTPKPKSAPEEILEFTHRAVRNTSKAGPEMAG